MSSDRQPPPESKRDKLSLKERADLDVTVAALRKPVRLSAIATLGLSAVASVIVVVTVVWEYVSYGASVEGLIAIPIACLAFGLPMILGMWRPWLHYFRLKKDIDAGLVVRFEEGNVEWSKLSRSLIATAGGKKLFSLSHSATPPNQSNRYDRFDTMRPGRYRYRMLDRSRFVLSAEPIENEPVANKPELKIVPLEGGGYREPGALILPPDDPPEFRAPPEPPDAIALRKAFNLERSDIEANSLGRLTWRQRWGIVRRELWWQIASSLFFGGITVASVLGFAQKPGVGAFLSLAVCGAVTLVLLYYATLSLLDFSGLRVLTIEGHTTNLIQSNTHTTLYLAQIALALTHTQARAMRQGAHLRFYYLPRTKSVVGVEPVTKKKR